MNFPNFDHGHADLRGYAQRYGLSVVYITLGFPLCRWQTVQLDGLAARLLGASYFLVLAKPALATTSAPRRELAMGDPSR